MAPPVVNEDVLSVIIVCLLLVAELILSAWGRRNADEGLWNGVNAVVLGRSPIAVKGRDTGSFSNSSFSSLEMIVK